ncbi:kinase-like domain-containing protein [Aspergillus leporis]|uniref:Kinase-like domain-containing protein n=1 Tax=Aspergillus leporis TaxID=41062 RepID=A0A5N5XGJ0_9EURO|nr:kinase-like domain-containing protein [Aspergillus leporis]
MYLFFAKSRNPLFIIQKIFYPVYIGEVFAPRYQVVSKLGYGTSSTAWLCRDLREDRFSTLKVCVRGQRRPEHKMTVSELLKNANDHPGKRLVRLVLNSSEAIDPRAKHPCLRNHQLILISLAFMHENHTPDISSNNILQGIEDISILSQIEEDEIERPIARKILDDRPIYYSRPMPLCTELPVVSDISEARAGNQKHKGDNIPGIYRAPEVILGMDWDCKVDIWSIGTIVICIVILSSLGLVGGSHLFFAEENGMLDDEQHLAEMVSLMGKAPPPSDEFLRRTEICRLYWDEQALFKLLRRIFRWLPEERPTAEELAHDDFSMQLVLPERK